MDQATYIELRKRLSNRMIEDQYGLHTICNLYYDTDCYDLIRTSLAKPVYKEKLRLRSYGVPDASGTVFLEIKKKFDGIVYKRRIPMTLENAEQYLSGKPEPQEPSESSHDPNYQQIHRELDWFLRFYHPKPKVYLAYDRIACYGAEDPDLRITFDQNIRYRTEDLLLSSGDQGELLLKPGTVLLELKLAESMPLWLSHILNELKIFPVSFSKYGTCYSKVLQYTMTGGIHCA